MVKKIEKINEIFKNKTLTIKNTGVSIFEDAKFKFRVTKISQLISMGEWKDYIFVDVVITSLDSKEKNKSFGSILNGVSFVDRTTVYNHAYTTANAAANAIQVYLKHFNIDNDVVVEKIKYNFEDDE